MISNTELIILNQSARKKNRNLVLREIFIRFCNPVKIKILSFVLNVKSSREFSHCTMLSIYTRWVPKIWESQYCLCLENKQKKPLVSKEMLRWKNTKGWWKYVGDNLTFGRYADISLNFKLPTYTVQATELFTIFNEYGSLNRDPVPNASAALTVTHLEQHTHIFIHAHTILNVASDLIRVLMPAKRVKYSGKKISLQHNLPYNGESS